MCAVWQVPNTVQVLGGLYCPFRCFTISPPVQRGTRFVPRCSGVSADRLERNLCGY